LSVIPLFILMGQFATQGGLSKALFGLANALIGHLRGGMAMASVLACAAFGSICGSSVATAATVSQVALPEMRRHGYSGKLATATLAAGGTLGILIPPSVVLVVYGILAQQNIAKLFAAAFIPGFIAAGLYLVAIALYVRRHPAEGPPSERRSRAERVPEERGCLDIQRIEHAREIVCKTREGVASRLLRRAGTAMARKVHCMDREPIGERVTQWGPRLHGAGEAVQQEQRSAVTGRDHVQAKPVADIHVALPDVALHRAALHADAAPSAAATDSHALR